ncbi:Inner membrane protein ybhI [Budvicia aquatica]|uniref:Inner membrane protein ybhI n=1 Tax=Budvicia aquatica TaxID=82979 RepID=A0A484ZGJ9_9GAMM|nr:Inner membrane protein ybhI [Budvicia aquatica]
MEVVYLSHDTACYLVYSATGRINRSLLAPVRILLSGYLWPYFKTLFRSGRFVRRGRFCGFFLNNTGQILVGYATSTVWLVFAAFGISIAFVKTGLGRRIAFHMIRSFGGTTLRLGYVTAFLEFVISPVTPSNTARSGGIVFPIILSVVKALGSEPGDTAKKAGSYLMSNIYFVMKVSSFMFITAMAPNLLAADFAAKIFRGKS